MGFAGKENASKGIGRELRGLLKQGRHVWRLVPRRHKAALSGATLLMAFAAACNTAVPLLLGKLVDGVKSGTEQGLAGKALFTTAVSFLGLLGVVYLVRELLNVARRYLVENSCTRLEKVMTVKAVSHLLKVDLSSLNQEKVGALQGRISRSVVGFVRFLRLGYLDLFPPLLGGGFALATALAKQPWLAFAMTGVIPLSVLLTVRQIISQKGIRLKLMRSRESMDGTVVELLGGMDYVRAANTQEHEVERLARVAERRRIRETRHHFQMSLFGCCKALNEAFFHLVVLGLALHLAVHGQISFGDILTFSMLFLNVMTPLNEIHRGFDEGHECSLLVADFLDILAEPVDRSFSPPTIQEPCFENGSPIIVVQDLAVDYGTAGGQRKTALQGVCLTIHHGETIGVVGKSGCGKSSWLRVLMRLTHPSAGQVLLGGAPLEVVSREAVGRLIGYVGQYPFVFAGTVAENIAYGTGCTRDDDIRQAAEAAFIHEEILAMPGGYQAAVTERGSNLSGGQRQRLALARVFLKNPPLLILDEGTSALDTISERNIQRALNAAHQDHTVILVAHRLSTLRGADRILVFDQGRVLEDGPYGELLARGGLFTELAHLANDAAPMTLKA